MVDRIKFKVGEQKNFLNSVINNLNVVSLRGILQFGVNVSYSSLKNYYTERRTIPRNLFEDLLYLSKIDFRNVRVEYLNNNWGQVKGGKKSKRK